MRAGTVVLWVIVAAALISVGLGTVHRRGDRPAPDPAPGTVTGSMAGDRLVHLSVLNGTDIPGLAADVSLALGRVDAAADRFGNAPHDTFTRSLLVNRTLSDDEARALAARLGGIPVILEYAAEATVEAVLVLGADHRNVTDALELAPAAP